jgi:hypothetical protein
MALELGAQCELEVSAGRTTHVVARVNATAKVKQAGSISGCHVVNASWYRPLSA